jgi:hypothetical protein
MKKFIISLILAIIAYIVSGTPATSLADDHGGCLTCHRYPGLVKYEKPDKIKVLHIDEEKHLMSSHGKTDCRQCHPKTVQIPHTNVTEVECNKTCHADDKEKIDNIDKSYLTNFHKEERFAISRLDDETSCRVCHPLYPHSEHNTVRAYINMHIGYTLCEVCHLKKEGLKNITYDWKEPEAFEFTGGPAGKHEKRKVKKVKNSGDMISKMLRIFSEEKKGPDDTHETVYFISRIAAFKTEEGKQQLFINTQDNDRARAFLEKEDKLSVEQRKKELDFFHRDIAKKEISVACNECHSPDGMMDFRDLGFHDKRAKDLEYMNIKGLVTKYDTFYIPNLFGPKK